MVSGAERTGVSSTASDDPRITGAGQFLRRYKLDELPQLVNVLKGDMSLVGPRPQVPWAVAQCSEDERQLLNVRPGITDIASLKFANEGEILRGSIHPDRDYFIRIHPAKMRLGLEYVRNHSLWGDCKILMASLWAMTKGIT